MLADRRTSRSHDVRHPVNPPLDRKGISWASTHELLRAAPRDRQGRSRAQRGRSAATSLDDPEGRPTIDRVLARIDHRHQELDLLPWKATRATGQSLTIRDAEPPNLSPRRQCREGDNLFESRFDDVLAGSRLPAFEMLSLITNLVRALTRPLTRSGQKIGPPCTATTHQEPRWLGQPATMALPSKLSYDALVGAARATGGDVHYSTNGIGAFKSIFDDFRQSYVLTYTLKGVAPAGWHALAVHIRRHREYTVHARPGYAGR
jgi:hypothetical protein